jgi:hypothetical protein
MLWHAVALALGKLTHGATGGQLTDPEVIMSRLPESAGKEGDASGYQVWETTGESDKRVQH